MPSPMNETLSSDFMSGLTLQRTHKNIVKLRSLCMQTAGCHAMPADTPERAHFIGKAQTACVDAVQRLEQRRHVPAVGGADHRDAIVALAEARCEVSGEMARMKLARDGDVELCEQAEDARG
jgi:hypothetical protein